MSEITKGTWIVIAAWAALIIGFVGDAVMDAKMAEHALLVEAQVLDRTKVATEITGETFTAMRSVSCNKGYGRSWQKYTGSRQASVSVTPVRITYASGRVWEGEVISGQPSRTIPCSQPLPQSDGSGNG